MWRTEPKAAKGRRAWHRTETRATHTFIPARKTQGSEVSSLKIQLSKLTLDDGDATTGNSCECRICAHIQVRVFPKSVPTTQPQHTVGWEGSRRAGNLCNFSGRDCLPPRSGWGGRVMWDKKWGWSWCAEELRGRRGRDQAWARDGLVPWPDACCGFVCRVHLLRAWQNWAASGTCTAPCWLGPRSRQGVGASEGFVFALWASLPVEKFLLVHLMPQKLPQKAVAAKHPCCKLNVPPVAPARSFYLVSQLRQQICLLRRDAWKTGFVIARRRWCSSNSLQSCSEEELICEAEGTKSGHIFLKWRWFLSLVWSSSSEMWLLLLRFSLSSDFLQEGHSWRSECSCLGDAISEAINQHLQQDISFVLGGAFGHSQSYTNIAESLFPSS